MHVPQEGRFGRPRTVLDASRVEKLLADGLSIREVARRTGYSRTTITRRFNAGGHDPVRQYGSNEARG